MDLNPYVSGLGREFAALAEAGGEEARALVERLTGPLESAIRMTLLDALSAAADEITRDLAPGSVQVRLHGRDPDFAVTPAPETPAPGTLAPRGLARESAAALGGAEPASGPLSGPGFADDGPAARINVRMPEQLKAAIEEAAAEEGRSVNAWLVRAATASLRRPGSDQRPQPPGGGKRARQQFTGWVR